MVESGCLHHGVRTRTLTPSTRSRRYRAIDVKLCLALISMLKTAGDVARVVRIEVKKLQGIGPNEDLVGRKVIAIIFESFRSSDNADVMFMIDNLIT